MTTFLWILFYVTVFYILPIFLDRYLYYIICKMKCRDRLSVQVDNKEAWLLPILNLLVLVFGIYALVGVILSDLIKYLTKKKFFDVDGVITEKEEKMKNKLRKSKLQKLEL